MLNADCCVWNGCSMDAEWKVDGRPYCGRHARQKAADRRHPTQTEFTPIATPEHTGGT